MIPASRANAAAVIPARVVRLSETCTSTWIASSSQPRARTIDVQLTSVRWTTASAACGRGRQCRTEPEMGRGAAAPTVALDEKERSRHPRGATAPLRLATSRLRAAGLSLWDESEQRTSREARTCWLLPSDGCGRLLPYAAHARSGRLTSARCGPEWPTADAHGSRHEPTSDQTSPARPVRSSTLAARGSQPRGGSALGARARMAREAFRAGRWASLIALRGLGVRGLESRCASGLPVRASAGGRSTVIATTIATATSAAPIR